MATSMTLNGVQYDALQQFAADYVTGELTLTKQDNGDLVIAGDQATWTVTKNGRVEEEDA